MTIFLMIRARCLKVSSTSSRSLLPNEKRKKKKEEEEEEKKEKEERKVNLALDELLSSAIKEYELRRTLVNHYFVTDSNSKQQ